MQPISMQYSIKHIRNNIYICPYIFRTIQAILKAYEFIHSAMYRNLLFLIIVIHHHDKIFTILVYIGNCSFFVNIVIIM